MNKFINDWLVYHEIQRLGRKDNKPSWIASQLVMDKRTVKKYLSMSEKEYIAYQERSETRTRKLAQYEGFVKEKLEDCLDASSAQVHDWLKEHYTDFPKTNQKTVYNFVLYVREKYNLVKEFDSRQYSKLAELPYGKQIQADFGEFNMTTLEGQRKKVYFFSMVLSRSRYKYVWFSEHPFTMLSAIDAHQSGFKFFGGYSEEVVYDQDKLFLTDENKGNLILNESFRAYKTEIGFQTRFCRKSDPESKGKIENVIRYIKYNFLRGRKYFDIHSLNAQALEWLDRTANGNVHSTTHLIPAQEWLVEKTHLMHLNVPFLTSNPPMPYKVRKDNTISFRGNFYGLPFGTYQGPETTVYLIIENETMIIHTNEKQEIIRHQISPIKGKLISNNNHYRDQSVKIQDLMELVSEYFCDKPKAMEYFEQIRLQAPRYVRDQIKIIQKTCEKYYRQQCNAALQYCMDNKIFHAVDFEPVLVALSEEKINAANNEKQNLLENDKYRVIPQISNISDYNQLLN